MNEITQSATPAPVANPIAPAPVSAPTPIIPPQINTMPTNAAASSLPNNTTNWAQSFKKAVQNPTPIIFGVLATTGLIYAIYYYRFQLQKEKVFVKSVQNKMDEVDMKLAEMESYINSIKEKEKTNQQQNQITFI